ncbi:DeoR/GlpR transcriptional regulator [Oxalobacteraceae bacterium]|nr:DeoR/GlpR transcriptional regulator [Oxalobacteraceae bacterium]
MAITTTSSMSQSDRLSAICAHLTQHYRIGIEDICQLYKVTRDTARRDLVRLDAEGRILRVRGGAVLPPSTQQVESFNARGQTLPGKARIGAVAAGLVRAGERVLFDASTTVLEVAKAIRVAPLSVLTNSIDIAHALSKSEGVDLHVLGGRFNFFERSLEGARTSDMLADFQVDKLFLGVCGIDPTGLTCASEAQVGLKRAMIEHATQVIMLADSAKFSRSFFHKLCGFEGIDILVTDQSPPPAVAEVLADLGVEVIVAGDI